MEPDNNHWFRNKYPELYKRIIDTPDTDLEVEPSRRGDPTLRIGNVQVHSAYDPVREAEGLIDKALDKVSPNDVIVVCGLGLGYLVEAVKKRFSGKIVVIEPDLRIVGKALTARSQEALRDTTLCFGLSVEEVVAAIERLLSSVDDWRRVKLIRHHPSVKLHPEYFEELTRLINARRNLGVSGLGILVVTPIYGGSLPVARYCASAFERLGHRVEVLDNEIYNAARQQIEIVSANRNHRGQLTGLLTTLMAESITARALDRAVDLVFLTAQSPMTPAVAQELRGHKIPTAFWFVEDWQFFTYWRDWAPLYDYFFTIYIHNNTSFSLSTSIFITKFFQFITQNCMLRYIPRHLPNLRIRINLATPLFQKCWVYRLILLQLLLNPPLATGLVA